MRYRWLFTVLVIAFLVWLIVAVRDSDGAGAPPKRIEGIGVTGWHARAVRNRRLINRLRKRPLVVAASDPVAAITLVFGRYAGQAVAVAKCESGLSPNAGNGQYRGLFQMGSRERALYGHGGTALEQARAAFVYFVISGRDWSPWTCKP